MREETSKLDYDYSFFFNKFFSHNFLKKKQRKLDVRISQTMPDDFYHSGFSDYCFHLYCYIPQVSVDVSSGLLQVFFVELRSLTRYKCYVFFRPAGYMP